MSEDKSTSKIQQHVHDVSSDFVVEELEQLIEVHFDELDLKPEEVKFEPSQSCEEPINLNTRIINLKSRKAVTVLACKTIYNAYMENDLNCLLRVGIIPNYQHLLEDTLKLLEIFRYFIDNLKNQADVTYINTQGMLSKDHKALLAKTKNKSESCDAIIKQLGLYENYALHIIQYNLLSGSTVIQDIDLYKSDCALATSKLIEYCNNKTVNVNPVVILGQYLAYKDTYKQVIDNKKKEIAKQIENSMNESSKLLKAMNALESEFKRRYNLLNKIQSLTEDTLGNKKLGLISKIRQITEEQAKLGGKLESSFNSSSLEELDTLLDTISSNYLSQKEKLEKLTKLLFQAKKLEGYSKNDSAVEELITLIQGLITQNQKYREQIHDITEISKVLSNLEDDDCDI